MSNTTLEEVWALFKETSAQMKETDRKFQETDRKFQETDLRFKETEQWWKKQMEELAKERKERDKEFDKKLGRLGNRLGDFVQAFIEPSVVKLFQERGIEVHVVSHNVRANNPSIGLAMEIDLFVINGDSCVLIEVKSNLSIDDVNEHIERMEKFKPLFPNYADKKIYGAVSGMVIPNNVAKYAYKKGFFVIAQKGDSAVILNDHTFQPIAW